jgi:ring-1,2-phenylacetyl-CoA epoxidase subunit PaaD
VQTIDSVWAALKQLPDPELPVLSIVDLGIVRSIEIREQVCDITLSPTTVGCPAIRSIRCAVEEAVGLLGLEPRVTISYADRGDWALPPEAAEKLRQVGIALAAPGAQDRMGLVQLRIAQLACPYCGSRRNRLVNAFSATPCRAVRHCDDCQQPFEQFKLASLRSGQDRLPCDSGGKHETRR